MPDLPTLTVTQEQANRMIAAWAPGSGDTNVAIENYKRWLADSIIKYVIDKEQQIELNNFLSTKSVQAQQARTQLMPDEVKPPTPPPPVEGP